MYSNAVCALNILLVNDDGYQAEGINTVYETLVGAGHSVKMVSPKEEQSGKGTSINTAVDSTVEFVQFEAGQPKYYLEGSPTDCTNVGISIAFAGSSPDLVVSGANDGENLGDLVNSSGTVSAAIRALRYGIPAIALSVGKIGQTSDHFVSAAQLLVKVISELEANKREGLPLLPERTGLNINYPSNLPADLTSVAGIAYTNVGDFNPIDIYHELNPETGAVKVAVDLPKIFNPTEFVDGEPDPTSEGEMFAHGYVTISTIDGRWDASERKRALIGVKLRDLAL